MRILEKYKLFFAWSCIRYEGRDALLEGAHFSGPVLRESAQIQEDTFIDLDLTLQNLNTHLFIPKSYYIARLSWKGVIYKQDKTMLTDCILSHYKIGSLKELTNNNFFVIDCSKHEEHLHQRNLVYPAWVMTIEKEPIGSIIN